MEPISYILSCFKSSPNTLAANATEDENDQTISNPKFHVFSYSELETAAQGFKNKIGEGGCGSVYKGRLIGYNFVAVKVLSVEPDSMRGESEFLTEIAALSDIRHENLVTLRGCCIARAQRLLVYNYMENNSLLHYFLGIVKGICYLHEELNPHIVHRDIKASNILLDKNFTPKFADFGLAKLFIDDKSHISTHVAGTLGYLSPEYAHSGHLTRKSDVYSFRVLLLEIVSGRRPIVDYHLQNGEQFLVDKALELYNGLQWQEPFEDGGFCTEWRFSEKRSCSVLESWTAMCARDGQAPAFMSTVIKMLNNEIETDNVEISRPELIADLKKIKTRQKQSFAVPA